MSTYVVLRLVHSWWRWAVLSSALTVLLRAVAGVRSRRAWTRDDDKAAYRLITALDIQVLLGIVLYFGFSPFWSATYHSFHETMRGQVARFFGIEHETAMLLAFVAAHVGRAGSIRARPDVRKHVTMLAALVVFLLLASALRIVRNVNSSDSPGMLVTWARYVGSSPRIPCSARR